MLLWSWLSRRLDPAFKANTARTVSKRLNRPAGELMAATTDAEIFRRIFEPEKPNLSPAAAKSILQLDFRPEDRTRMDALAQKAHRGKLTKQEDQELETFLRVGHLLTIMQSKARQSLKKASSRN
jgi:hypothetical protein